MKHMNTKKAYKSTQNIYDDIFTQKKWWAKLYINIFWNSVKGTDMASEVFHMIPENFDGKLLDVPAGTAVLTSKKYKSFGKAEIICLDYSEDMLAIAKQRFQNEEILNIKCIHGDVEDLNFANECFDIVLSMNGFHAFPNKEKAFTETARVLKKRGIFCGCFYIKGENKITDFLVNKLLSRKGWFIPPFMTFKELKRKLSGIYTDVCIHNSKSIAYFKCVK